MIKKPAFKIDFLKETRSVTMNIFRYFYFLFKSFVKKRNLVMFSQ